MYLKALSLRGFKSFAHTTNLEFSPGINAVVGPNGSGKSNIVDALSWVMGEQGAKSLRAGSMSEVIFSGSSSQKGLGRAQVKITIDNSDQLLPLPLTDIEISRTVFRNGGSEYQINGQTVRLTDLQELMAAAHLGKSKHSLISQGHIERVLNATGQERRQLIEEAAGISAFRLRAEQTEAKLQAMKANLDRLEDLEAELSQQLEPLGEQAQAARSAREIQAQIRQLRSQLLAQAAHSSETKLKRQQVDSQEQQLKLKQAQLKIQSLEEQLKASQEKLRQERIGLDSLRAESTRLERVLATTAKISAVAEERQKVSLNLNLEDLQERADKSKDDLEVYQEKASKAENSFVALESTLYKAQEEVDKKQYLIEQLFQAKDKATEQAENQRQVNLIQTQALAQAKAHLESAQGEADRRQQEVDQAQEHLNSYDLSLDRVQVEAEALLAELTGLEDQEKEARIAREDAHSKVQEQDDLLKAGILKAERAAARAQTLRKSLPAKTGDPVLFESVTITDPWHTALAVALGRWEEAQLQKDKESSWLCAEVKTVQKAKQAWVLDGEPPAFLHPALDFIQASDQELEQGLALALYGIFLHAQLTPGQRKELKSFLAKNPLAQAIDQTGRLQTAYGQLLPQGESSLLELQAASEQAQAENLTAQQELAELKTQAETAQQDLELTRQEEKKLARKIGKLKAQKTHIDSEIAQIGTRAESAQDNLNLLKDRAQAAQKQVEEADKAYQQALKRLQTSKDERVKQETRDFDTELAEAQQALALSQQSLARLAAQTEFMQEERALHAARLIQLGELHASHQQALEEAIAEHLAQEQAKQDASRTQKLALKLAAALEQTLSELALLASQKGEQLVELEQASAHQQNLLVKQRQETEEIRFEATELTIELEKLKSQWVTLESQAQEELDLSLADLLEKVDLNPDFSQQDAQDQLLAAEKELVAIGTVNPLALEEFKALNERHTYLAEQIKDLKLTRADLRSIIKELNERITEEFADAFSQTAAHFERIFARLFPDGEGSLSLSDPTDLMGSGIEIHARPAGKKLKRLSLLSGGERALASLAFLTAIFAARPTPFYVLDEVEAALDDRNLGRLLEVFTQLAQQSQLIIITHKTRTIEIADMLYGISMKDGVSLVLEQNLAQLRDELPDQN